MEDTTSNSAVSRRRFVGIASAVGALPILGRSALGAAAAPAMQEVAGEAFPNGINVTRYTGADGSYEKYRTEGIRLGLIEAFPVNFTDPETGERTGWNTDSVLRALAHCGIDKIEYVDGPWDSMVPGLQSGRCTSAAGSGGGSVPQRHQRHPLHRGRRFV